jgi:hypothetical protein
MKTQVGYLPSQTDAYLATMHSHHEETMAIIKDSLGKTEVRMELARNKLKPKSSLTWKK